MKLKPLSNKHFFNKMLINVGLAAGLLILSLAIGMIGYKYYLKITWVDSLLNASMILTGMGPVDKADSDGGKIFASVYAIYSGVAFLTSVAFLAGPIFHKLLHTFHIDLEENE